MAGILSFFLDVPVKKQNSETETFSEEKKSNFLPDIFRIALKNMKSEDKLAKYLQKQAQMHPKEYREAIQDYFKEKLEHRTGLMRHVSFFDSENTSTLHFMDVVQGFKDLGFGALSAYLNTALVIGGGILGTQELEPPIEKVHNLAHPLTHTALFNQNPFKFNNVAHAKYLKNMIERKMKGRDQLGEKDIIELVDEIGKQHPKNGLGKVFVELLRPLQIIAFTNVMNLCGGSLKQQDFEDFYNGTLFYGIAEPSSVAHRVMTMR
ncbi:caleosin family protein [Legionella longbeachae]|uniref:Caleosin related protein n=1 Tax=Legionella longbeachae serogroup 1 (strain NSW150) TaxID=661367 RepID=D3HNW2_LEGLN|nr:caleosin family protein [Legionella longbeachae]VEE01102.1 Uncharacterised protein [Legionella oakridgensis]HBD7398457.1 hypothetical protein [Legionella pneumophila]ARB92520.1 hypothetical protein A6J40_10205 [Legionella longbeachae]ARM34300.1 hypothetical protein B0B39_12510 [Legionella longbeachae]EEZ96426.1 hypothetical protein LLB_1620 [Legionella longbeachae D-4968]